MNSDNEDFDDTISECETEFDCILDLEEYFMSWTTNYLNYKSKVKNVHRFDCPHPPPIFT